MVNARFAELFREIYKHQLPLLQLMSNDLVGTFYTGLDTTKCLNTAVMMMFLLGGEKGLKKAFFCNVDRVSVRYANLFDHDMVVSYYLQRLFGGLLAEFKRPALHYIMLTDAELTVGDESVSFPGHAFVIERTDASSWTLHQSYINSYKMESVSKDAAWVRDFCRQLTLFMVTSRWNDRCSDFWTFLTHVGSDQFVGYPKGSILLCHQKLDLQKSGKRFVEYLTRKLQSIQEEQGGGEIYGNEMLYSIGVKKGIKPMTNDGIRASIEELLLTSRAVAAAAAS
jgi:hypothetical protein